MEKYKTLVLIDGNAILHRAYHALPPMSTKDGMQVNAAYGFASLLLKILHDTKPDGLAVAFDLEGGTFRDDLYEAYKATRVEKPQELYDQLVPIKDILDAMDIPYYEIARFEADDVIGTIATRVAHDHVDWRVVIVTGDLDELQLVEDRIHVYFLKKGISQYDVYDADAVRARFGFEPMQLIDYKAIAGDASDNIKGVAGIGAKGATNLIQTYGTVERIYEHLTNDGLEGFSASVAHKLRDARDSAFLSKKIATIVRDVDVDFSLENALVDGFDEDRVREVFGRLEFSSLISRVPGMGREHSVRSSSVLCEIISGEDISGDSWKHFLKRVQSEPEITMFVHQSEQASMFDSGLVAGCVVGDDVISFDLRDARRDGLMALVRDHHIRLISFDVKRLFHVLRLSDVSDFIFFDVMLEEYVLHAGRDIELDDLLFSYADVKISDRLRGRVYEYVATVADGLKRAHAVLAKEVLENKQESVLRDIEYPLIPVLYAMERRGVAIDPSVLDELRTRVVKEIAKLEKKMYKEAGIEFNISSSVQLREVLFEKLQLPTQGIKKGKTGYSTAASELEKLQGLHPLIDDLFVYREMTKLQSTYIDALPQLIADDGRIHTTFAQAVAATGRLASHDPNLQNIPMRTALGREVRAAFVAADGYSLLTADYSQFELRIVAHLSGDKELKRIFEAGEDVHTSTASKIHGIPLEQVTKDIRRSAKEVNFGVMYGMGAFGLSQRTGLSVGEASTFIEKYFEAFIGVKTFIDHTIARAEKLGYAETMYGRRRALPELASENRMIRASGERMAINMPVQGTQADMVKLAMIAVEREIHDEQDVRMLLQVHDELVFEVKKGVEHVWVPRIKRIMEDVVKLDVPIAVDVHVGDNWRDVV